MYVVLFSFKKCNYGEWKYFGVLDYRILSYKETLKVPV